MSNITFACGESYGYTHERCNDKNAILVAIRVLFTALKSFLLDDTYTGALPFSSMSGSANPTASPASLGGVTWGSHSLRVRFLRVLTSTAAAARTLSLISSTARSTIVQMSLSLGFSSGQRRPWSRSDKALQLASLLRHNLPPISCRGSMKT